MGFLVPDIVLETLAVPWLLYVPTKAGSDVYANLCDSLDPTLFSPFRTLVNRVATQPVEGDMDRPSLESCLALVAAVSTWSNDSKVRKNGYRNLAEGCN